MQFEQRIEELEAERLAVWNQILHLRKKDPDTYTKRLKGLSGLYHAILKQQRELREEQKEELLFQNEQHLSNYS
jgi:hypothetical protein